jgi:hypothetical protein
MWSGGIAKALQAPMGFQVICMQRERVSGLHISFSAEIATAYGSMFYEPRS